MTEQELLVKVCSVFESLDIPYFVTGGFAAICLLSSCATERAKPEVLASCCVTNLQMAAERTAPLTDKSIYQIDSTWTTDTGLPVKLATLRGRPQIVAMFFTSCSNACPITVSDIKRIDAALPKTLRGRVGYTLISFDPQRDTTAALKAYRQRRELNPTQWTLLRGEPADVAELATRLGMKIRSGARGQFGHSNLITVLNPEGEIVHQQIGLNQNIDETVGLVQRLAAQ